MQKTIIFDLDGTLANIDSRRDISMKPNGKLDWDVFAAPNSILALDKPNAPVIKMAQMFKADGFKIVIFSGRNDRGFDATVQWLNDFKVPFDLLVMRPDKLKMLDAFVDIDDVFLVVDDRDKVVKMWRDLGLNTFQVAPGDF